MTTSSSRIPSQGASDDQLAALAEGDGPVLEAIAAMNLDTLALSSLDPQSYMLVRLAALVAVNAPPASYLANLALAADVGLSREDVQGVLTAIAPIVGSPRIIAAAGNTLRALGLAELAEEAGEG
jgi:4-carboxymuconolactone decarboxylase